jgi:hypothetical protein
VNPVRERPASTDATREEPGPEVVTVYTVAGTGNYDPRGGKYNFPQQVVALLDPAKFSWSPIRYPAAIPFKGSVAKGKAATVDRILQTPGRFALLGFSQGAMVISQVYEEILDGALTGRDADFLAGVTFGNPCRRANHTFPGYSLNSRGIADEARRLVSTDSRWWDMAARRDIVADVCDDLSGDWMTAIFMALWGSPRTIASVLKNAITTSPTDLREAVRQLFGYFGDGTPHTRYAIDQPLPGNPMTFVELAAQRLTELAEELVPAQPQSGQTPSAIGQTEKPRSGIPS